jgi:hypothetical protein
MELLEFVVYTAVGELLARIRYIKEEVKSLDMIYGEVHPIYYRLQYYFHGNALVKFFHERASTAMEEPNLLQDSKKEEVTDSHRGEQTTTDGMNMVSRWTQLARYASLFCDSYQISCDNCMVDGHFTFQCNNAPEELLVPHASEVFLEYLVYKGSHDPL